jgi:nitrogen fixation NifU-like protein
MMSDGDEAHKELDTLVENISRILEQEDERLYSKAVIEEFKNPSNVGRMPDADGSGLADGLCLDTVEFYVKIRSNRIEECTFYTDGCGVTIACGSRLARLVKGMSLEDARNVSQEDLISLLGGLPPEHEHCAALSVIALRNALRDYERNARRTKGGAK